MLRKGVSVILATYNGSKYIERQLDSILIQSEGLEEIIICDDNSTDETPAILAKYSINSKVKVFISDKQLGVVGNFKKAARLAIKGNWIIFADQDDIWIPQKLNRLTDEMQLLDDDKSPVLIYSDLSVIDKNDTVIYESFWNRQKIKPEKIHLATLLYGNVVTGCTMIINYLMAEEFFLMKSDGFLHDEWLALIAYSIGKAKFLNDRLVLYRQHSNNITFSDEYKEPEKLNKLINEIKCLFGERKFLKHQFKLAEEFLLRYRNKLSESQINILLDFIKQENKNYILQRINRRIAFS